MSDGFEFLYGIIYPLATFLYLYAIFALVRIWHYSKKQVQLLESIKAHLIHEPDEPTKSS